MGFLCGRYAVSGIGSANEDYVSHFAGDAEVDEDGRIQTGQNARPDADRFPADPSLATDDCSADNGHADGGPECPL